MGIFKQKDTPPTTAAGMIQGGRGPQAGAASRDPQILDSQLRPTNPFGTQANRPGARYGIDKAIELMRALPVDSHAELVVKVIKRTLESTDIHVPSIIEDATKRQQEIQARIADLTKQVEQLDAEIAKRQDEISRLNAAFEETSRVREYLLLAEEPGAAKGGRSDSARAQARKDGLPEAPPKDAPEWDEPTHKG